MILYQLRTDEVKDELDRVHTVYGIDVFEHIRSIPDVFTDSRLAEQFVNKCNLLQLAPIHLNDAIENSFSE